MEAPDLIMHCSLYGTVNHPPNCPICLGTTLGMMVREIVKLRNELDVLKKEHREHSHYYWDSAGYYTTTQVPDYIPDSY